MRNAEWGKKIKKDELGIKNGKRVQERMKEDLRRNRRRELRIRRVIAPAVSLPSPNSVSSRSPFANMETDLSLWRSWRKHQLADGVEDDLKLGVVFVFERGKLAGKFRIREEHFAQAHKCAHDGDVDLHGPRTPQGAGSIATPCSVKA
jgi:hypothetical protein